MLHINVIDFTEKCCQAIFIIIRLVAGIQHSDSHHVNINHRQTPLLFKMVGGIWAIWESHFRRFFFLIFRLVTVIQHSDSLHAFINHGQTPWREQHYNVYMAMEIAFADLAFVFALFKVVGGSWKIWETHCRRFFFI